MTIASPTAAVGDYLLLSVHLWNGNGATVPNITSGPAGGWTTLQNTSLMTPTATRQRLVVYSLPVTSLPLPASYSIGWGAVYAAEATLSSFSGITGVESSAVGTGIDNTPITPGLTAAGTNRRLLTVVGHTGITAPTPAGMTAGPAVPGYQNLAGLHTYHQLRPAAGATGTRSTVITGGAGGAADLSWIAISVLLVTSPAHLTPIPLSWPITPSAGADGYEIVRDGGPTTWVSGRATLDWSDTTTASTAGYSYTITATGSTWRSPPRSVTVGAC